MHIFHFIYAIPIYTYILHSLLIPIDDDDVDVVGDDYYDYDEGVDIKAFTVYMKGAS